MKSDGRFGVTGYNKHAFLHDDQRYVDDDNMAERVDDLWDIEDVAEGVNLEE